MSQNRSRTLLLTALLLLVRALTVPAATHRPPNLIVILSDDMGFSDLGCYGGEIRTPALDALAAGGLRFTQFYNTARCCPTRAALLTGLYPHQAGIGHMMEDKGLPGYRGDLNRNCVTLAEALKPAGYRTYALGKWHVARDIKPDGPKHNWPLQRGFDRYYGTITGAGSFFDPGTLTRDNSAISPFNDPEYRPTQFYYTHAISDHAVRFVAEHQRDHAANPFLMYVAYTAAHWPMHALEPDIARYRGRYDQGYDPVRKARLAKARSLGLIKSEWTPAATVGDWDKVGDKAWEARCMEVYAAMIDAMDQGIGRLVAELKKHGQLDNTLILFLQDNGGCAETIGRNGRSTRPAQPSLPPISPQALRQDVIPKQNRAGVPTLNGPGVMPGPEDTYIAYGQAWANVSNTPFREYKHWVHEGGISTPLIAHWPAGITDRGALRHQPGHLIDIMATCLDLAGATYPTEHRGEPVTPLEGRSLKPAFTNPHTTREPIFWEHEGNRALRDGPWKLVAKNPTGPWELYHLDRDRTEQHNLADREPARVKDLATRWSTWANRAHVLPWPWKDTDDNPPKNRTPRTAVGNRAKTFHLQPGASLAGENAPAIADRAFTLTVEILAPAPDGVLVAQGGIAHGFSLYLKNGLAHFALRRDNTLSLVTAKEPLPNTPQTITATLVPDATVTLRTGDRLLATAKFPGLLSRQPIDGLDVGRDDHGLVGEYPAHFPFTGRLGKISLTLLP